MRSLRLFGSDTSAPKDESPEVNADGTGLLAFASETEPEAATQAVAQPRTARAHIAIALLATLVLLQAIPTVLWLKGRFAPPVTAASVAAPPPAAPAPLASAVP